MATEPYSEGVGQVAPSEEGTPGQRIQTSPMAFGGGTAQGLQAVGQGATKAADFWGDVQTDTAVNTSFGKANALVSEYRTLRGQDALDRRDEYETKIDDAFREGRDGLALPKQQLRYDQEARSFRERYIAGMVRSHADQQGREFTGGQAKATHDLGVSIISSNPNDDDSFALGISKMLEGATKTAQLNGFDRDPTYMGQLREGVARTATEARINSLLASPNPDDLHHAKDILEANRSLLATSAHYDTFVNKIETTIDNATAEHVVREKYMPLIVPPGQEGSTTTVSSPNNIGNVKTPEAARAGVAGPVNAATPVDGVLIAANNLRAGYKGMSVQQIAEKWAPAGDRNNPQQWAANVASAAGVPVSYVPNLDDPNDLTRVIRGIGVAEKSPADRLRFSDAVLREGVDASLAGKTPKTVKADILLSEAQGLERIHQDFEHDPRMERKVAAAFQQQYQILKMGQQSEQLRQADQMERTLREGGDMVRKDPTQPLDGFLAAHPELREEQVEHLKTLREKELADRLNGSAGDLGPGFSNTHDQIYSGKIINLDQLAPMLRDGSLTVTGYNQASQLLTHVRAPGNDNRRLIESNFWADAKKAVTMEFDFGGTSMVSKERREAWDRALPALTRAIDDGRAKGYSEAEMMAPDGAHSVWPMMKPYLPTAQEAKNAALQQRALQDVTAAKRPEDVNWRNYTKDQATTAWKAGTLTPEQAVDLVGKHPEWGVAAPAEKGPRVPAVTQ